MFRNSYTSKNLNITHKNLMNRNHFCGRFLNFWTKCFEPLKFVHLLVVSKTTQSTPVGGLKNYSKYTCWWSQKLPKVHLFVVSKITQSTSVGGLKIYPKYLCWWSQKLPGVPKFDYFFSNIWSEYIQVKIYCLPSCRDRFTTHAETYTVSHFEIMFHSNII